MKPFAVKMRETKMRVERKRLYSPHPGRGESRNREASPDNGLFIMCASPSEGGWSGPRTDEQEALRRAKVRAEALRNALMFILLYTLRSRQTDSRELKVDVVVE